VHPDILCTFLITSVSRKQYVMINVLVLVLSPILERMVATVEARGVAEQDSLDWQCWARLNARCLESMSDAQILPRPTSLRQKTENRIPQLPQNSLHCQ
jgi:hypothetical protein